MESNPAKKNMRILVCEKLGSESAVCTCSWEVNCILDCISRGMAVERAGDRGPIRSSACWPGIPSIRMV